MSMFRTSKDDIYPVSFFDKCTNSKNVKKKCDVETFKSYIQRDLEKLLNTRCLHDWRMLHKKGEPPKNLVKEGEDPNAFEKGRGNDIFNDEIVATPEEKEPQRTYLNVYEEYGLSDYSTRDLSQPSELEELVEEIKCKIEAFIPQLKNIKVIAAKKDEDSFDRVVRFNIEAALNVEGESEELEFDTNISHGKNAFSVKLCD